MVCYPRPERPRDGEAVAIHARVAIEVIETAPHRQENSPTAKVRLARLALPIPQKKC
jgi:hypothetical protein